MKRLFNYEKMRKERNSYKVKYESQLEDLIKTKDEIINMQKQMITIEKNYKKILKILSDIDAKIDKGGKNEKTIRRDKTSK